MKNQARLVTPLALVLWSPEAGELLELDRRQWEWETGTHIFLWPLLSAWVHAPVHMRVLHHTHIHVHTYQKWAICKNFKEPKCRLLLQSFTGTSPVFLNQSQWRKRKRRASVDLPTVMIWLADVHTELEGDSSGRLLGCKSRKLAKPDSPSRRWTWASLQPKVFPPHTPICRSQLLLSPSVAWEPWTKVCCSWGLKLSSPLPGWVLIIFCPRKARGEVPRCWFW